MTDEIKGFVDLSVGYDVTTDKPIDRRLVLTKEQMLNINDDAMPDNYFCICKSSDDDPDNGKIFVYKKNKKNNEIDKKTGNFRPYVEAIYHDTEARLELKGF